MLVVGGADLKQRTLSALVLVPLVLAATYAGGLPFAFVWTLAGLAVGFEWARTAKLEPFRLIFALAAGALIASVLLLLIGRPLMSAAAVVLGALAAGIAARGAGGTGLEANAGGRLWAAGAVLSAAAAAMPVIAIRGEGTLGLIAVLFLFAVVWTTDVAAYFVGRAVGGPKLWRRLSPNKTWSGAVGGTIGGILAGLAVAKIAGLSGLAPLALLAALASVCGQAGDLAESAIKRHFGVKDTGRLIPGHGGVMDRLDGFTAAALFALAVALVRDAGHPASGLMLW